MSSRTRAMRILWVGTACIVFAAGAAVAQDEGGGFTNLQEGALIEIPAATVPMVIYDFDAMPAGPTTVAEIQAAFAPPAALLDITNTPRNNPIGVYNFQTAGGRALAAATDGSGGLVLIDAPAGAFDEVDDFTIVFNGLATEFGFEIGDWGGPINVECFAGAVSVGAVEVDTTGGNILHFVQSPTEFDSCSLTALPQNPAGNWVIPSFQIPESVPVELMGFDIE